MAQPFDRTALLKQAGDLDWRSGEFWVGNPFDLSDSSFNLSAFEANRTYLGVDGEVFLDLTYQSGMDSDGDGRASVGADFNNDGMPDLLVRQTGGGPLLLYENHFPRKNYLKVSLRGKESNSLGIGARIALRTGLRTLHRQLYPVNSFRSQSPALIHFGLGQAQTVDWLKIQWPSGNVQEFKDIGVNRHLRFTEGSDTLEVIYPRGSETLSTSLQD